MSVSRQTLKYCIAACDLGSRSHVIGAVIFSLRVKVQWSHLFPLSCLLTVCYQLNRSCSAQFTAPHAAVWWKRILCVASDWMMTGERRQHLCNFTLLCHVHTSLSYSHFFSICVDLFPPFTPLKSSPEEKKKEKVSVSVYLFVFRVFARIIAWAYLWLPCVLVWLCWEVAKSTKRRKKKGKLQKHLLEKSTTVEVIVWGKTLPLLLLSTLWTSRETQQEHRVEAL